MSEDYLNNIFKNVEGQFDTEEPNFGHKQRFLDKLNNQNATIVAKEKSVFKLWKPILSVAASIVLLLTISLAVLNKNNSLDLASISPEMATTQDFFTNTIASELAIAFSNDYEVELYYCFEKNGVLADINDDNSVVEDINQTNYQELKWRYFATRVFIFKVWIFQQYSTTNTRFSKYSNSKNSINYCTDFSEI